MPKGKAHGRSSKLPPRHEAENELLADSSERNLTIGDQQFTTTITDRVMKDRPVGKRAKLTLFDFMRRIFEFNEADTTKPTQRVTDAHIRELIRQEYAHVPRIVDGMDMDASHRNRIPQYRSMYNNGQMGNVPPTRMSVAYDSRGKPVRGNHQLSPEDLADMAMSYDIPDVRFLSKEQVFAVKQKIAKNGHIRTRTNRTEARKALKHATPKANTYTQRPTK